MCHHNPYWKFSLLSNCWPLIMQPRHSIRKKETGARFLLQICRHKPVYIFIYWLLHKLKRFLNVELAAQPIRSLIHMIANTCMIDLYPASAVVQRRSDLQFQVKLSPSSPSGILELKLQHAFGIPHCVTPSCPQNLGPKTPPLSRNSKMVWYGYFLESPIDLNKYPWHLVFDTYLNLTLTLVSLL